MSGAINGLTEVDQRVNGVSSTMQAALPAALALAGGAAAVGGAFGQSISVAADFEHQMSGIRAVLSPDEVNEFGGALQQLALTLGRDTVFSSNQAAQAIEELVKAGVPVQTVMEGGAASALALAAATGINVSEAATFAGTALNTFHLNADQLAHTVDTLAGTANASAADIHDLQYAFASAGPVAASLGLSFDDTATALGVFANNGLRGSDAGTSLRTMLLNLEPSSNRAAGAMRELGIITDDGVNHFFDATGAARPMNEIFQVLRDSTANLTAEQRTNLLQTAFGTDAVRAATIAASAGAAGFNDLAANIAKVTAADAAATRLNDLHGSLTALGGSFETIQITIGNLFLPILRQVVDGATAILNAFLTLDPSIQTVIVAVIAVAGAISGLVAGMILLGPVVAAAGASFAILTAAASPFLIPILAIGAAVAALYLAWQTDFGGIQEITAQVFEAISPLFTNIGNVVGALGQLLGPAFQSAQGPASSLMDVLNTFAHSVLEPIPGIIRAVGDGFNILSDVIQSLWHAFQLLISGDFTGEGIFGLQEDSGLVDFLITVHDAISGLWNALQVVLTGDFSGGIFGLQEDSDLVGFLISAHDALVTFGQALDAIRIGISALLGLASLDEIVRLDPAVITGILAIRDALSLIGDAFQALIAGDYQGFFTDLGNAFSVFGSGINVLAASLWNGLVQAFQALPGILRPIWDSALAAIGQFIQDLPQTIATTGPVLWAGLQAAFGQLSEIFETVWQAELDAIGNLVRQLPAFLAAAVPAVWSGLIAVMGGLSNLFAALWQNELNAIGALLGQLPQFIVSHVPDPWQPLVQGALDMGGRVVAAIGNAFGFIGQALAGIRGIIDGLGDPWASFINGAWAIGQRLGDAFGNFIRYIGDAFRSIPGIVSGIGDLWASFINGAWNIGQRLGDAFGNFLGYIGRALGGIPDIIRGLPDLWAPFIASAWNIGTHLGEAFANFLGYIGRALSGIPDLIRGLNLDFFAPLITAAWQIGTHLGEAFGNFLGYIGEALRGIPGIITGLNIDFFAPLVDAAWNIGTHIGEAFGNFLGFIGDALRGIPGLITGLGVDFFGPIIDAAGALVGRIGEAIEPIRRLLADTFGNFWGFLTGSSTLPTGGGGGAPGGTTPLPTGGAGGPIVSIGTLVVSSPDEADAFLELVAQAVLASARRVTPPVGGANPALG